MKYSIYICKVNKAKQFKTYTMKNLFNTQELKNLASNTNASFFQDTNDTIRIVYVFNGINYTEMYFGSEEKGFRKHY